MRRWLTPGDRRRAWQPARVRPMDNGPTVPCTRRMMRALVTLSLTLLLGAAVVPTVAAKPVQRPFPDVIVAPARLAGRGHRHRPGLDGVLGLAGDRRDLEGRPALGRRRHSRRRARAVWPWGSSIRAACCTWPAARPGWPRCTTRSRERCSTCEFGTPGPRFVNDASTCAGDARGSPTPSGGCSTGFRWSSGANSTTQEDPAPDRRNESRRP